MSRTICREVHNVLQHKVFSVQGEVRAAGKATGGSILPLVCLACLNSELHEASPGFKRPHRPVS
ncbi:MAG: hypothetical protein QF876_02960 [Desulfobacterales bacterium]|nr:hypothetical protein [Desulfobacterales bacterium]MDP6808351.1 hypothetical protein [Desulfobacterales bacterium]